MMSDEEELKILLARAEMLVTEAKEILMEAKMEKITELEERLAALDKELMEQLKRRERIRMAFWILVIGVAGGLIMTALEYYLRQ